MQSRRPVARGILKRNKEISKLGWFVRVLKSLFDKPDTYIALERRSRQHRPRSRTRLKWISMPYEYDGTEEIKRVRNQKGP